MSSADNNIPKTISTQQSPFGATAQANPNAVFATNTFISSSNQFKDKEAKLEHILYEIDMFKYLTYLLIGINHDTVSVIKNSMIEAWAIHFRNLNSFLYVHTSRYSTDILINEILYPNDVNSFTNQSQKLLRFKEEASQKVAHLTKRRVDDKNLPHDEQGWNFLEVYEEIAKPINDFISIIKNYQCFNSFTLKNIPSDYESLQQIGTEIEKDVELLNHF